MVEVATRSSCAPRDTYLIEHAPEQEDLPRLRIVSPRGRGRADRNSHQYFLWVVVSPVAALVAVGWKFI